METDSSHIVYILGTAGSGKSALTLKLSELLFDEGWNVIRVNMDPGVRQLPYNPEVDVSERCTHCSDRYLGYENR